MSRRRRRGEAILVPQNSPIKTLADLKGKKVALNKGANVHFLLVRALESAGVKYSEIEPIYLAPADARAAFERGAVDAWVIWDPFLAAAEAATGAATLIDAHRIGAEPSVLFCRPRSSPTPIPRPSMRSLRRLPTSIVGPTVTKQAVAEELSAGIGIPAPVLEAALKRQTYGVHPLDDEAIADQQRIADTFYALGLDPQAGRRLQHCQKAGVMSHRCARPRQRSLVFADARRRPPSRHHDRRARGQPSISAADRASGR